MTSWEFPKLNGHLKEHHGTKWWIFQQAMIDFQVILFVLIILEHI